MKVNKELLKKVILNGNKCLCSNTKNCPCSEFLNENVCKCGVYITNKLPECLRKNDEDERLAFGN